MRSRTASPKADAYTTTMYIMAGLLVVGFVCNLLVRPVDERHVTAEYGAASGRGLRGEPKCQANQTAIKASAGVALKLVGAWTLVGIPLAWGVWQVIQKSLDLFK